MNRIFTILAATVCGGALAFGGGCSSSSSNAGTGDDGGGGSTVDVVTHHDTGTSSGDDSSTGDDSSASMCPTPADISTWMPPAYKSAKHMPTACGPGDIAGYDMACLNQASASTTACNAFKTAHAMCAACLTSNATDTSWGPLVVFNGVINVNGGGCFELYDGNASCAKSLQTVTLCEHQACDGVCPVKDQNSFNQWQMCDMTALAQGCGMYATAANNCAMADDGGAGTFCNMGSTFDDLFMNIAPLFCGGASTTDGGTEGGTTEGGPGDAAGGG